MARKKRKSRFSGLLDYLDHRLGAHSGDGPEYQYWCPFCIDRQGSESEGRKLWLNIAKTVAHCFRCNYGTRDLIRFFRDLNGGALRYEELDLLKGEVTPPEADVASAVFDILVQGTEDAAPPQPVPLPPEMHRLAPHVAAETKPIHLRRAFRYLKERKISGQAITRFDIGFCVDGRYAQRLIFPVHQNGQQVYFTNRYCGGHQQKSLNPEKAEGVHTRSTCLLNYDSVVGAKRVVVAEGAFDTMSFRRGVGLMGKFISAIQVNLIAALTPQGLQEVIICLDADTQSEAETIYRRLVRRVPSVRVLSLEWGDPHERASELQALIKTARAPSLASGVRHRLQRPRKKH